LQHLDAIRGSAGGNTNDRDSKEFSPLKNVKDVKVFTQSSELKGVEDQPHPSRISLQKAKDHSPLQTRK
jgi:hypothetical protein